MEGVATMHWLDKLERKYGRFHIEGLMLYITATMLCIYIMDNFLPLSINISDWIDLSRSQVLQGQVWRLVTFIFLPPASSPVFVLFALYFYYFIGTSLEEVWGSFQFNIYYLFGVIGTIIAGLITGYGDNTYLNLSLFLAFAQLFPEHQVLLFFFIPIKIKYLAYLDWILFAWSFIVGSWTIRAAIVASLINFFLFFGPGMFRGLKNKFKYRSVQRNWRKQMKQNGGMR